MQVRNDILKDRLHFQAAAIDEVLNTRVAEGLVH
jgi:hypothetical protein